MPEIARFLGMVITMYCEVGEKHKDPHFHVKYGDDSAEYHINGTLLKGGLPNKQHKRIVAWAEEHHKTLELLWDAAYRGERVRKVREVENNETD